LPFYQHLCTIKQKGGLSLEINVLDDEKLVTIWLTRAEQEDVELRERLKSVYAKYKAKKYMVAQFHSGTEDLYEGTRDLLLYNRRRSAELAIKREKELMQAKQKEEMI
jgi:hypothetical protein